MGTTIVDKAPELRIGEFVVREVVSGDEYQKIIRLQNRHFGDRGASAPGLYPAAEVATYETTFTSYAQINRDTGPNNLQYGLDRWQPQIKLARKLRDGAGGEELKVEVTAVIENLDLEVLILKGDDLGDIIVSATLSSSALAQVSHLFTLTEADAAQNNIAGAPERLLSFYARARVFGGASGTGYMYAGPKVDEYHLQSGDESNLPRGF